MDVPHLKAHTIVVLTPFRAAAMFMGTSRGHTLSKALSNNVRVEIRRKEAASEQFCVVGHSDETTAYISSPQRAKHREEGNRQADVRNTLFSFSRCTQNTGNLPNVFEAHT